MPILARLLFDGFSAVFVFFMSSLEPKDISEFVTVKSDDEFRDFIGKSPSGIALVPQTYGDHPTPVIKALAGDFAKWMAATHPEVKVEIPGKAERLLLRNEDYWLPLAFLASDIALPIYLNLVASYLYDKLKGALPGDKPRVHLSAEYENKKSGVTKRFNFVGDAETLKATIKKFDLNGFLDDDGPAK
jgi:hypothetical protein